MTCQVSLSTPFEFTVSVNDFAKTDVELISFSTFRARLHRPKLFVTYVIRAWIAILHSQRTLKEFGRLFC